MTDSQRSCSGWRLALTVLSALGLGLSSYLGWHYLTGGSALGCEGGSACDQVLKSRWSTVGGVLPVSGLAVGVYLALLVASLSTGPATVPPVRQLAWRAMLVLAGAVIGSAMWFTIVQKWLIGAFCPYCMATHLTGLLLAGLVFWCAPMQLRQASAGFASRRNAAPAHAASSAPLVGEDSRAIPRRVIALLPGIRLTLVGLGLAGILAVCQVALTPPGAFRGGESLSDPVIDPRIVPLIGSPDAPYVVSLLFDYNCLHCQRLHLMLNDAIRQYGGKLAFALHPTPLNRQCNPYISRDANEFKDSCALARVGLAVWLADHDAFSGFDNWMFSFESGDRWQPRSLDAAKAKAAELVGQARFDAASTNAGIERLMQASIRIFANTLQSGNGAIPKLVFGSHWVVPEPNEADDFVSILQNSLGVPKP